MSLNLIIKSKEGEAEVLEKIKGEFNEAVKEAAKKALELWDLTKSDFIIIKDKYPVEVKLPITPQEYEEYSKYNIRRSGPNIASFDLPIYVISYNNEWIGNDYRDYEVFIIAPYVNEKIISELVKWAAEITSTETLEKE
ncbi:MAG: DUF2286 domain-containing protein [archaeon GB-1867-035]|nr:DUF2286 domain-containing protein [Candidatus Culexmicrobium profundum]